MISHTTSVRVSSDPNPPERSIDPALQSVELVNIRQLSSLQFDSNCVIILEVSDMFVQRG